MKTPLKLNRYIILFAVIAVICVAIVARVFKLQVVMGEHYREQSENQLIRSMPIKAPRGEILDKYGRPLITNRQGFSIIFHKEYIKAENLNSLILRVINGADSYRENYIDTFPVTKEFPFEFNFPGKTGEGLETAIDEFKKSKNIDISANANDTIDFFAHYYKIEDGFTADEIRKIIGVRYEMENRLFSNNTPYTFATDVDIAFVTFLKEQQQDFRGVRVIAEPIREYANGDLAAHILGRAGVMYKEEYETLRDKGYNINDIIGKDGMEKYLEEYLRGKDGVSSVEYNISGVTSRVLESQAPIPGNYAVLTIDARLQQALEDSLSRNIRLLRQTAKGKEAHAGAGVVIDVNTGEVLAMASYPTFDPSKFNEQWDMLSRDTDYPMWNRAIAGQYAPGSVFKILSAVAALESGVVLPEELINCEGVYKAYASSGYAPVCWIYSSYGRGHGRQNVTQALENSCNYYFYEVGRRMEIETMHRYGKEFGLGEQTKVELTGEEKGIFASREYRKKINSMWYPGDTLQAAIGQSDHMFTPIQLANFIATIANGGKRHKVHLVKSVKTYGDGDVLFENKPELINDINISYANYKAVLSGMKKVSETGTASSAFINFKIPIGSKTGSASVPNGADNGLFVAFAPFDDPQIALAIVVEHAGGGGAVAPIARDVIEAYMSSDMVDDEIQQFNELIR
ncbi:MAG: penicillin-binding protein 2 [Firmicutes bacterium]|nr:penicillin-binding protein 2 [Bacillota bacterium]